MGIAIAIAVVALLLAGFLVLTSLETRRGARVLPGARHTLDSVASRATRTLLSARILTRAAHDASLAARYAVHEVAHIVLEGIRFLERTLTRVVRAIRESNAAHALKRREKKAASFETTGTEVQ